MTSIVKTANGAAKLIHFSNNSTELELIAPISASEKLRLAKLELVVAQSMPTLLCVGQALMEIKRDRLYRAEFPTFEAYCRTKWDFGRTYAHRVVRAAETQNLLLPMGNIALPENERQLRALSLLPPNLVQKAWAAALEKAKPAKVTTAVVTQVVKGLVTKDPKRSKNEDTSWQRDVRPVLNRALKALKKGDQSSVVGLVQKAMLLLEVGRGSQMNMKEVSDATNP